MRYIYDQITRAAKRGEEAVTLTTCSGKNISRVLYTADAAAGWADKRGGEDALYTERDGEDTIILERFTPRPRMIVFGGGHIAVPLVRVASMLRFDVTVYDDRPNFANRERFPDAGYVICDSFSRVAELIPIRPSDCVVIVTRGHKHDEDCLRAILSGIAPYYAGMVGSRRRAVIVRQRMKREGFDAGRIDALRSPIGLAIGAVTPEEIVISIMAEVVKERRMKFSWADGGSAVSRGESDADMELLECLARDDEEDCAMITVVSVEGSTPRSAGAKMIARLDGSSVGSIGGGCAEAEVLRTARQVIADGGWKFQTVDMTGSADENGMFCGGVMTVLIERLAAAKPA
jgi:xanthine dehydrogenase accessory factor